MDILYYFADQLIKILPQIGWLFTLLLGYLLAYWQFKLQSIHKRRLEVIEEAYSKIRLASRSFKSLTAPLQEVGDLTESDKEKDFAEKANDMFVYLDTKRLFFDTREQKHIDNAVDKFFKTWGDYRYKKMIKDDPALHKERFDLYKKVWDSADKEIPEIISLIEEDFKKALGLK